MHILHFISAYGPAHIGNEIHGELGRAIIARGHHYSVLTLASRGAPPGLHTWDDGGITVYEMGRGRGVLTRAEGVLSQRLFHYQPFLFALRSYGPLLRGPLRSVDLVLVEGGYPLGAIAALWQPVVRPPLALVLQGGDMHREEGASYGFGRYPVARWLLRLALRRAALMRTYSPLARDAAIERGASPERVKVVAQNIGQVCYLPPDTDPTAFRAQTRAAVVARHNLRGSHLLVTVGRLLPIKGFDGLIKALPRIEQMVGARVEVVLCGPARPVPGVGNYRTHLEQLAAEGGVSDRLRFTGELPHTTVRDYLAAADALVVPSVMEGGAKVVMEAAAVGTPFVATETAGTPAFLPDAGLIVPPLASAPDTFVCAAAVVLRNDDLRARLGQRALDQAPRFSAERRADELLPLYEAAARAPDSPPRKLCYIAYPTSLSLQSANALQTYTTLRELRARRPDMLALIARWGRGESRFAELGALHLPRPSVGKLSRLYRSSLWYYLEYSLFAWMCVPIVATQRVGAIYVRQNICAAWWSSLFGPILGVPVVYEAHDMEARNPSRAREPWAQGWVHMIDRLALTRSAAVVSLTEEFRRYLARIGWRHPDEVFVVPDAYDDTVFCAQDRAACRAAVGLPPDVPLLAYAGLTFSHRWLEGLLEAVARLLPTHAGLRVVLVGGRPTEIEALRQQAAGLGIEEQVVLVGAHPLEEVVTYLGAADVLVIPDTLTDMTASPLKLFEYLALGAPLVLPNLPALREIVPLHCAHYFPRRDREGLVQALDAALRDGDKAAGAVARQAIAREHTYGCRAERILKVVEDASYHCEEGQS